MAGGIIEALTTGRPVRLPAMTGAQLRALLDELKAWRAAA